MNAALAELRAMTPTAPEPLVFAIVQRAMAGQTASAHEAFEDFIFRFGGDSKHLLLLAEPLGEIRDVTLLEACIAAGKERGYPLARFQSLLCEVLVYRGEWLAATKLLAVIPMPGPQASGREIAVAQLWRDWIQKMIDVGTTPSEVSQLALTDFLRMRILPTLIYRKTVETLWNAGRLEAAREVLALATRAFPTSAWFQAESEKVLARLAARDAAVAAAAPIEVSAKVDLGETEYWKVLEGMLAGKRWSEAARHIQAARTARPSPEWLHRREAALRLAQVRVGHALADRAGMLAATRIFLNGDDVRSQQILDVAKEVGEAGDKESAILLTREVLRRVPGFAPAQEQLRVLQPPLPEKDAKKK
ncbi:MAG: hypothetical protein V4773_03060 [Verrucomicrobiota bacterium]